jgi:excisionase family DNA binding protein
MVGNKLAYTIPEAIASTGIGRTKLYAYMRDGRIKHVKAGRRTLIKHSDLVRLIDTLPAGPGGGE